MVIANKNCQCEEKSIQINMKRLSQFLQKLSRIGKNENGGIDRALGSEAEKQARAFLTSYWENELHLPVKIDPIANMWAILSNNSSLVPIILGSHHDTVPNGGMFDGALGILVATEIVQTIQENGIKLRHPLGILSFTGEEPNPFQVSTLGSKVACGKLSTEDLLAIRHKETGESLADTIAGLGGNVYKASEALLDKSKVAAFIECHVEQGRRLMDRSLSLASVSCITGIYREIFHIHGEANHAGTTVMRDRKDALLAACEINLALEKIAKDIHIDEVVGTIGSIKVLPNAANIIPGSVELTADIRTCDPKKKEEFIQKLGKAVDSIIADRKLRITRKTILDQPPTDMSNYVRNVLDRAITLTDQSQTTLVSMAGHDAANMQLVTDAGMLFVKSIDGKSHCPEEFTQDEDIHLAAQALLQAVLILDKELD